MQNTQYNAPRGRSYIRGGERVEPKSWAKTGSGKSPRSTRRHAPNFDAGPPSTPKKSATPEQQALALSKSSSESDIQKFLEKQHTAKIDLAEKNRVIEALVKSTSLKKSDLNKMWKAIEQRSKKGKTKSLDGFKGHPVVNRWDHEDLAQYAKKRIITLNEEAPFIFHFSGELARISENERGVFNIETMTQPQFEHELNEQTKWSHVSSVDGEEIERGVACPSDIAKHVYSGPKSYYPPLSRLVTVPTYTKRLKLTAEGYQDGIYYKPQQGLSIPKVSNAPTAEEVKTAVHDIADLFGDIPFDGMSRDEFMKAIDNGEDVPSFSHLLSYGLSSIVRELIKGPIAGHLGRKDKPRSGASLALMSMERIATCQPAAPQTLPVREEEIQKVLMSALIEGAPYILFDNIKGGTEIESDALAGAMTAYPSYKGRLLGASKMSTVPSNAVYGFTGNRSALSPQLAERMLLIDIDPKMENPGMRSGFKHNISAVLSMRAGHYLWCLLTMVQNWIAHGCPEWAGISLGGFERHAAVVGGILESAGVNGFMANRDKLNALVKADDPVGGFMDVLIAENKETGGHFEGTLFKVGTKEPRLPVALKKHRVVSFREVLENAQVAMNGYGYKTDSEGEVFYPVSADNNIKQKIPRLVGNVRDDPDGGSWRFEEHPDSTNNSGKLYVVVKT